MFERLNICAPVPVVHERCAYAAPVDIVDLQKPGLPNLLQYWFTSQYRYWISINSPHDPPFWIVSPIPDPGLVL